MSAALWVRLLGGAANRGCSWLSAGSFHSCAGRFLPQETSPKGWSIAPVNATSSAASGESRDGSSKPRKRPSSRVKPASSIKSLICKPKKSTKKLRFSASLRRRDFPQTPDQPPGAKQPQFLISPVKLCLPCKLLYTGSIRFVSGEVV